jgi:hypothetical protein
MINPHKNYTTKAGQKYCLVCESSFQSDDNTEELIAGRQICICHHEWNAYVPTQFGPATQCDKCHKVQIIMSDAQYKDLLTYKEHFDNQRTPLPIKGQDILENECSCRDLMDITDRNEWCSHCRSVK